MNCVHLQLHNSSITGMAELDGKLVTASLDGTVKMWMLPENTKSSQNGGECRLSQLGEFSTASGAPMTCLHAMSSRIRPLSSSSGSISKELPMETNEIISVARKRKRKGEDMQSGSQHYLGQRLSTSGIIVVRDRFLKESCKFWWLFRLVSPEKVNFTILLLVNCIF